MLNYKNSIAKPKCLWNNLALGHGPKDWNTKGNETANKRSITTQQQEKQLFLLKRFRTHTHYDFFCTRFDSEC